MLNIYTPNNFPTDYVLITDVESEFRLLFMGYQGVTPEIIYKDLIVIDILNIIDHAKISDYYSNLLQTKFGSCSITDCSTGAKAVILAYLYKDKEYVIDTVCCGENAIAKLVELGNTFNLHVAFTKNIPIKPSHTLVTLDGETNKLSRFIAKGRI